MKKFRFVVGFLLFFAALFGQEIDFQAQKEFYSKQYKQCILDEDYLQAYAVLKKMQAKFDSDADIPEQQKLEEAIFSAGKSAFENYNADRAVKYLQFYAEYFLPKKAEAYDLLAKIYTKTGEKGKADFFAKKASELQK